MFNLNDFLDPVNIPLISNDEIYREGQIGKTISVYEDYFPDLEDVDIIIMGCNETRGNGNAKGSDNGIDAIRKEFYSLYLWHKNIRVADIGNIRIGAELNDTYAA